MQTLNYLPENVLLFLPLGKAIDIEFELDYDISTYAYVSKIIDCENTVVATLTCTPDILNRTVTVSVSEANALLIESDHKWYIEQVNGSTSEVLIGGKIKVEQVTDL